METTLDELGAWCAGCVALNLCSTLEKLIDKSTEKYEKLLLQLSFTHLKFIHSEFKYTKCWCVFTCDAIGIKLGITPSLTQAVALAELNITEACKCFIDIGRLLIKTYSKLIAHYCH